METTYHRDGTVTVWSCVRQEWIRRVRPQDISDETWASMSHDERRRVARHGITRDAIRDLAVEARRAGDATQEAMCDRALAGSRSARAQCVDVIAEARLA